MIQVLLTATILASLMINQFAHGFAAWGMQPGGGLSSLLFSVQVCVSVVSLVRVLLRLRIQRDAYRFRVAIACFVIASVAAWQYLTVGWKMYTTADWQGCENLPTVWLTALVAVIEGGYSAIRRKKEMTGDLKSQYR